MGLLYSAWETTPCIEEVGGVWEWSSKGPEPIQVMSDHFRNDFSGDIHNLCWPLKLYFSIELDWIPKILIAYLLSWKNNVGKGWGLGNVL